MSGRQGLLLGYMKLEMNIPGGESAPHALFSDLKYETPKEDNSSASERPFLPV